MTNQQSMIFVGVSNGLSVLTIVVGMLPFFLMHQGVPLWIDVLVFIEAAISLVALIVYIVTFRAEMRKREGKL